MPLGLAASRAPPTAQHHAASPRAGAHTLLQSTAGRGCLWRALWHVAPVMPSTEYLGTQQESTPWHPPQAGKLGLGWQGQGGRTGEAMLQAIGL